MEPPRTPPRGCQPRSQVSSVPMTPRTPSRFRLAWKSPAPGTASAGTCFVGTNLYSTWSRKLIPSSQVLEASSSSYTALSQRGAIDRLSDIDALEAQVQQDTDLRLYKMKNQKRKDVWYFARLVPMDQFGPIHDKDLTNEHGGLAICLLCSTTMKFRIGKHKMVEHMNGKHADELETYRDRHNLVVTTGGPVQTQHVVRRLDFELMGAACQDNRAPLWTITPKEQQKANKLLARWVARHFRPMIIVEDGAFKDFVLYITHELGRVSMVLPNRSQLRDKILALAVYYQKLLKEDIICCCAFYSLTSDISTGGDGHSYISLTIHFVTDGFELRSWTLEVQELPGIHDGAAIAAALNEMSTKWGLLKEYCTKLVRDGGTNMVSGAGIAGFSSMSCVAHSLHLVVAGALIKKKKTTDRPHDIPAWTTEVTNESTEPITEHQEDEQLSQEERENMDTLRNLAVDEMETYLNDTLVNLGRNEANAVRGVAQRFRTLACYFRKSPKGQNRLAECQVRTRRVKHSEALRVQVDCPTRWNSCWDMLQRLILLEGSLVRFFAHLRSSAGRVEFAGMEDKLWRPKASDWLTIKCLTTLLMPFGAAMAALSGQQYPTIPLVVPILHSIRKHLSRTDLFGELVAVAGDEPFVGETQVMMNDCRRFIQNLFDERFTILENSELAWVAFLDPRIGKRMSHLSAAGKDSAEAALLAATRKLAREFRGDPLHQTPVASTPQTPSRMTGNFLNDLFGPDEAPHQQSDLAQDCADEFTVYLSDIKTVRSTDDPLLWWRVNHTKYPNLSRLTRKWLGAVATSVPSERAFSTSGNILTVKRSSLAPSMVRDLVFITQNWQIDNL